MKTAIDVQLIYVKSTKNTHVYGDAGLESGLPTLYIKKSALPDKAPAEIYVTVQHD